MAYWNCNGTNGGNTSYCSASNYSYGTTGQCGYTAGSCTTGYSSNTTYSGGYTYWNCTGTNNVAVSCNIYGNNNYGTTGQCGTSVNSCVSGTFYDTTDSGSYAYWNCNGTNGTSVSCSAYNNNNNYNNYNNCSIAMPTNAYYTNSQSCWSCNAGFVQINNMCVWWN
jgi:hypothetical protein